MKWLLPPTFSIAMLLVVGRFSTAEDLQTRSLLIADSSKETIAIVEEDSSIAWQYKIGPLHDLHMLENGNVLFQTDWTTVVEIEPKTNKVVWSYDANSDAAKQTTKSNSRVEIHAFQRLDKNNTMIAESGRTRIVSVDTEGNISQLFSLTVARPDAHRDTRLVRKTKNGTFLVCQEGDGLVREYDSNGKIIWEYAVPLFGKKPADGHGPEAFGNQCFAALRLENGNTLISTGNGHSIIEVTPEKEIVWKLDGEDLEGVELAWITTLQVLPSGNIVFGNCHAGPDNPQVIEVNRDKQIVWTFRDFERFGNSLTNTQVLTVNGELVPR